MCSGNRGLEQGLHVLRERGVMRGHIQRVEVHHRGVGTPAVQARADLPKVQLRRGEVDRKPPRCEEQGHVQQLVQVTLRRERHRHDGHGGGIHPPGWRRPWIGSVGRSRRRRGTAVHDGTCRVRLRGGAVPRHHLDARSHPRHLFLPWILFPSAPLWGCGSTGHLIGFLESGRSMAQRGELGRQLPLRGPLKALEADIHHANAM
jgi:hypothetical protein